jgi:hypothetical protein
MAINIITTKVGDSCRTEDVNRLFLELCRKRIFMMTPGQDINFYCYTDTPEGLDEGINILPLTLNENITDLEYYKVFLFDELKFDHDTNIIWDVNLQPLDLSQTHIIRGFPIAGDVKEADEYLPDLDLDTGRKIRDERLPFLQAPTKWFTDDTDTASITSWFLKYHGNDCRRLLQSFIEDPVGMQEKYGSFAEFVEGEFKGVLLPTAPGIFSPYYINDKDRTDALNAEFEEKVRPYFPDAWEGHGGEEEAPFLEWEHEYRDVSKQVKFLYFDGEDAPESDRYLLLWFL